MNSVFFLILRRMRAPLIALVLIYAIAILGLVTIPGIDAAGQPTPALSFFHAFYFISYTASTIGFGEIPAAFSDAQRLWVTLCIYLSVIGWSYSILTVLGLFQDKSFLRAIDSARFLGRVKRLREPFYLVCGCGETGGLLIRALDQMGLRFVVLEISETRINELELEDFRSDVPALVADAQVPQTLLQGGIQHPRCRGVLTLTNDDRANLAVAITARLVNPSVDVVARVERHETAANMASFGVDHIINPYEKFAEYLALAMRAPGCYRLLQWLTGIPGTRLRAETAPPPGQWVVCGYGRFGKAVVKELEEEEGMQITIVDPNPKPTEEKHYLTGFATEAEMLRLAGIEAAAGIVAGTDNDVNNLSIVMTARELNHKIYVVMRQNLEANKVLFDAFQADLIMVPSETIAHECLAILTTPLMSRFLAVVKGQTDAWADRLIERLYERMGDEVPTVWSARISAEDATAPHRVLTLEGRGLALDCLLRHSSHRDEYENCFPLLVLRGQQEIVLPDHELPLQPGDQLLFAGTAEARIRQDLMLRNANVLDYVLTGRDIPGGWVWRQLALDPGRQA